MCSFIECIILLFCCLNIHSKVRLSIGDCVLSIPPVTWQNTASLWQQQQASWCLEFLEMIETCFCFQRNSVLTSKLTRGQQLYRGINGLKAKINLIKRYSSEPWDGFVFPTVGAVFVKVCRVRTACSLIHVLQSCFLWTKCPVISDWGSWEHWIMSWVLPANCFCLTFTGCMKQKQRMPVK